MPGPRSYALEDVAFAAVGLTAPLPGNDDCHGARRALMDRADGDASSPASGAEIAADGRRSPLKALGPHYQQPHGRKCHHGGAAAGGAGEDDLAVAAPHVPRKVPLSYRRERAAAGPDITAHLCHDLLLPPGAALDAAIFVVDGDGGAPAGGVPPPDVLVLPAPAPPTPLAF